MIKVFTLNKNNKIELSKKELEDMLNEAYWEGYKANSHYTTITYPYTGTSPYTWTNTGTLQYNGLEQTTTSNTSIASSGDSVLNSDAPTYFEGWKTNATNY